MKNFALKDQKQNEKTLCIIEKHWIVHVPTVAYIFFLCLVTAGFFWLYALYPNVGGYIFCFIVWPVVLMYLLFTSLLAFLDDRLDLLVVTSKRLVDITQIKFLKRDVSEAGLLQIQDVKGRVHGIISAIFGIGTIYVQTAGRQANFEIDYVADPVEKAQQILEISRQYREYTAQKAVEKTKDLVAAVDISAEVT